MTFCTEEVQCFQYSCAIHVATFMSVSKKITWEMSWSLSQFSIQYLVDNDTGQINMLIFISLYWKYNFAGFLTNLNVNIQLRIIDN